MHSECHTVGAPAISRRHDVSRPSVEQLPRRVRIAVVHRGDDDGRGSLHEDDDDDTRHDTHRSSRVGLPRLFKFALTVSFGEPPATVRTASQWSALGILSSRRCSCGRTWTPALACYLACLFVRYATRRATSPIRSSYHRRRNCQDGGRRSRDARRTLMT